MWERPFGLTTGQIGVAKLLSYHAQLAFHENQSQIALEDITLAFRIARGVEEDPSLVGGLVSLGVAAIARANVVEGLERHAWTDTQLAEIQESLKKVDCLATFQFSIRSEGVMFTLPVTKRIQSPPGDHEEVDLGQLG